VRIEAIRVAAGLPPEVMEAVLRTEGRLNEELALLLEPEALARLRDAEVEFTLRMIGGKA
jgi:hypothetical protein